MKRLFVSIVVIGLIVGSFGIEASAQKARKVKRSVTTDYSAPGFVYTDARVSNVCADGTGCLTFNAWPKEKFIFVKATDKSTTPVAFEIQMGDHAHQYCGEMSAPISLRGESEVGVNVGIRIPDCQGLATQGAVKVTFSNLK